MSALPGPDADLRFEDEDGRIGSAVEIEFDAPRDSGTHVIEVEFDRLVGSHDAIRAALRERPNDPVVALDRREAGLATVGRHVVKGSLRVLAAGETFREPITDDAIALTLADAFIGSTANVWRIGADGPDVFRLTLAPVDLPASVPMLVDVTPMIPGIARDDLPKATIGLHRDDDGTLITIGAWPVPAIDGADAAHAAAEPAGKTDARIRAVRLGYATLSGPLLPEELQTVDVTLEPNLDGMRELGPEWDRVWGRTITLRDVPLVRTPRRVPPRAAPVVTQ